MDTLINDLYAVLTSPYGSVAYESMRERLINRLGYDKFRDIQLAAFKMIGAKNNV